MTAFILFIAIVFCSSLAQADLITLKSGKRLEGTITQVTDSEIMLNARGETYKITYTHIREIKASADASKNSLYIEEASAHLARSLARGRPRSTEQPQPAPAKKIEIYIAQPGSARPQPKQAVQPRRRKKVEIYTTTWCPVCRTMRDYLNKLGVRYQEYDIEKNPKAGQKYAQFGSPGVPVLVVDDEFVMAGFSEQQVAAAVSD